jgi:hypothetical protein
MRLGFRQSSDRQSSDRPASDAEAGDGRTRENGAETWPDAGGAVAGGRDDRGGKHNGDFWVAGSPPLRGIPTRGFCLKDIEE